MRLGFKRVEEHGDRYVHFLDPETFKGILMYYDVEIEKLEWIRIRDGNNSEGREARTGYLLLNKYFPTEVPDEEFNGLYEKLSLRGLPLFREMGDFKTLEISTLQKMVEESNVDYAVRVGQILLQTKKN